MRIDRYLQFLIMGRLGSFWGRSVAKESQDQARTIASLAANSKGLAELGKPLSTVTRERRTLSFRRVVPFMDGNFVCVGESFPANNKDSITLTDGRTLQVTKVISRPGGVNSRITSGCDGRLLGEGLEEQMISSADYEASADVSSLFLLPIPKNVYPVLIETTDPARILVSGIDFEVGDGYVVMRESPSALLPSGGFVSSVAIEELPMPYDFLTQVNGATSGSKFVTAYCKGSWSASSFEKAAAQACGLFVVEEVDTLLSSLVLPSGSRRYVFLNAGTVDIDYPHSHLTPGTDYPAGFIVGADFRVVTGSEPGWLRRAAGVSTLLISDAVSLKGIYLPSASVSGYYVETGAGGKPHARLQLIGSEADLRVLWAKQLHHERETGLFLSDVIDMTPSRPRVTVDFHAMLEGFYGNRLLLIKHGLLGADLEYLRRLKEFVSREKPAGAVVLIEDLAPAGIPAPGTFEPTDPLGGEIINYGDSHYESDAMSYLGRGMSYGGSTLTMNP